MMFGGEQQNMKTLWGFFFVVAIILGCGDANVWDPNGTNGFNGAGGKQDSGWIGADTYEVGAVVRGIVRQEATGDWSDLANDTELQHKLVDSQLKFVKNTAESHDWRFNQLADRVNVVLVTEDFDSVTVEYEAVVDMLGRLRGSDVPALADIDPTVFNASVPVEPGTIDYGDIRDCSKTDDGHSAAAYNFHYYFQPDQPDCSLETNKAQITITTVFGRPKTYPEYDKLMQPIDTGLVGFKAALVPNRGDNDPLDRFNMHKRMLENELNLMGEESPDGAFVRYMWTQGGVAMVIDLYNPTELPWMTNFASSFRKRLSHYTLVHYNGHSSYGTKNLLDDTESYSDDYQIVVMHSCQSYAYYTRQAFRAKATSADPSGHALMDVVATGKSSYPSGAPPTLKVLLKGLMDGMIAIDRGRPENATDWITIAERMKDATFGDILYGIAGVRSNSWDPENVW
jgi:hypothetical protein